MANIAQSVNVISPLMTTKDGIEKQTTWWPLLLFSKYMRGTTIAVHVGCACYEGETSPDWLQAACDTPWLDVAAALNDDGMMNLAVVNVHLEESFDVELAGIAPVSNGSVTVHSIMGGRPGIVDSRWDGKGKFSFPKSSITMLRWKAK
jgi:alpha-N-arabinofuranosidase